VSPNGKHPKQISERSM